MVATHGEEIARCPTSGFSNELSVVTRSQVWEMDGQSWGELPHLLSKSLHRELGRWKNCVVCWGTNFQTLFLALPEEEANTSTGVLVRGIQ